MNDRLIIMTATGAKLINASGNIVAEGRVEVSPKPDNSSPCNIDKVVKMVNMCNECIKHEVTCIGSDQQQEICLKGR